MDEDNLLDQADKANNRPFVVFDIKKEKDRIEISKIREIVKLSIITKILGMPEYIEGMTNGRSSSMISKSKGRKFFKDIGKIKDGLILLIDQDKVFLLEDLNKVW